MKFRAFLLLGLIALAVIFPKLGASFAVGAFVLALFIWLLALALRFIVGPSAKPPAN